VVRECSNGGWAEALALSDSLDGRTTRHLRLRPEILERSTFCCPTVSSSRRISVSSRAALVSLAELDERDALDRYIEAHVHGRAAGLGASAGGAVLDLDTVQSALRNAANLVRTLLLSNQAPPAIFRAKLDDIPPRDRDGWLDLLWDIDEIPEDDPALPRGCVPYLPCPVATVREALERANVTSDDVFVDVGSGTGRTTLLANLLTGAGCIGLEIQPALVEAARGRAAWLNLDRTRFVQGDAAELLRYITIGTVFFFYCPFSGERLDRVLDDLEAIARTRQIRICCVHMPPLERPWLVQLGSSSPALDVYQSAPLRF